VIPESRKLLVVSRIALLATVMVAGWIACRREPSHDRDPAPDGPSSGAPVTAAARLVPGQDLSRPITGPAAHRYHLAVPAASFVRVTVVQDGIDLVLVVRKPGAEAIRADSPSGGEGPESLAFVTEVAAELEITVEAGAKAGSGRYQLRVDPPRPIRTGDREQAAAERALAAAREARREKDREGYQRAGEEARQAARLFALTGDRPRRLEALEEEGRAAYELGDLAAAAPAFEEAAELARDLGLTADRARLLNRLGPALRRQGHFEASRQACREAASLAAAAGETETAWNARNNLAVLELDSGHPETALGLFTAVRDEAREAGERAWETRALAGIGAVYVELGDARRALRGLEELVEDAAADSNREAEAIARTQLGRVYRRLGELSQAAGQLEMARGLWQELQKPEQEGEVLTGLTLVYPALGRQDEAFEVAEEALRIFRRRNLRSDEVTALLNLGWLHEGAGRPKIARDLYESSLDLARELDDPAAEAAALHGLARALSRLGRPREALRYSSLALERVEQLRVRSQARRHRASFFASKLAYYELQVDLFMDLHALDPQGPYAERAFEASEATRARNLLHMLAEGRAEIRRGIDPEKRLREEELRERIGAADDERRHLLASGDDPERLERVRGELEELLARYEALEAEMVAASPRYAELVRPRLLSLAETQREVLDADTQMLVYFLGERRSFLWWIDRHGYSVYELASRERIEGLARRTSALFADRDYRLRGAESRAAARELAREILGPVAARLGGTHRLIVVPMGALHAIPFQALPHPSRSDGTGPGGDHLLIEDFEITYLPSVSVLSALRAQHARRRPSLHRQGLVAILADAVYSPDDERLEGAPDAASDEASGHGPPAEGPGPEPGTDELVRDLELDALPRLPYSGEEAEAIRSLLPPDEVLVATGFDARRELVEGGALAGYPILHFATHGFLHPEYPAELSGIVLSRFGLRGEVLNGFVRLQDLLQLDLPAELVVASACHSARGEEIPGEGVVGLTRGFMDAGASRLVVSLWSVSDRATARLMEDFYRGLLREGLTPGAALRRAQLALRQHPRWGQPYYWAPFLLQGDPGSFSLDF